MMTNHNEHSFTKPDLMKVDKNYLNNFTNYSFIAESNELANNNAKSASKYLKASKIIPRNDF